MGTSALTITAAAAVFFSAMYAITGCGKKSGHLLVLDDWWAVDIAEATCKDAKRILKEDSDLINSDGCESVAACPELRATDSACTTGLATIDGPYALVRDFDDRLKTELAVNPQCSGITVATFDGPKVDNAAYMAIDGKYMDNEKFSLIIDHVPGAPKQAWTLQQSSRGLFAKGDGDPKEIADKLCPIIAEGGARIGIKNK